MKRPQEHLTDATLGHRLMLAANEPKSCSALERKQYMTEAAFRLEFDAKAGPKPSQQAARVVIGHCPSCGGVVVRLNNYEVWDVPRCPCGWGDDYDPTKPDLINQTRYERDFVIGFGEGNNNKVRLPPRRPVVNVSVSPEVL